MIVELRTKDAVGYGETCPLAGYSKLGPMGTWEELCSLMSSLPGSSIEQATKFLTSTPGKDAFALTGVATALEGLRNGSLTPSAETSVPLVGLLEGHGDIESEIEQLRAKGYVELKVKVGFDVDSDVTRVKRIQQATRNDIQIRIDANQAYSVEEAAKLAEVLDPSIVRFFEQPLAVDEWDAMSALNQQFDVAFMLDEAIYSVADIERTARNQVANFVKLKLMKFGSAAALLDGIALAQSYGLNVILGNGVASDIGCFHEAVMWERASLDLPGEMNGFTRPIESPLESPIRFANGALVLDRTQDLTLNREVLERRAANFFTV